MYSSPVLGRMMAVYAVPGFVTGYVDTTAYLLTIMAAHQHQLEQHSQHFTARV